jgi:hypothetical protein
LVLTAHVHINWFEECPSSNSLYFPLVNASAMSKSKIILVLVLIIGGGGLSLYLNRDSFAPQTIQISHRVSPWLKARRSGARRANDLGDPVVFTLSGYYRLTSVKVVLASEMDTNKYAHPLWSLVSESNSPPTSSFIYGGGIRGMHLAVKGARPDPLVPGTRYRLLIATSDKDAQHDFEVTTNR